MPRIVVLGAGPAGCSAGYHLAKSGHQVTLIDKATFPRDKICGDGISFESVQALFTLGIYPQDIKCLAQYAPVCGLRLGVSNGNEHMQTTQLEGYCIPRFELDNLLYQHAVEAGCIPQTQTITDLARSHPDLYHDYDHIIDARGVYAGEANAIAIRAYWSVKVEDFPEPYCSKAHIYFDPKLGVNGYGWLFPVTVKDGLIKLNVGVILWLDEYQKLNTNIIRLFDQFVQKNETTKALLSKLVSQQKPRAYPLTTAKRDNRVSDGKVLKIGDAANLTDPLTGEGIANALLSGLQVAQAINMSVMPAAAAENWQRLYQIHFEPDFQAGLWLKSLRKSFLANQLLISLMKRNHWVAERVMYAVAGLIPYSEFVPSLRY
ncbi:NAD(P)/FAD-dependent oxidoreductase [Leptolyngbya sp. FACHB-261]|uniref:NAD(P)/FAD-dependent oxidoreductase n=1 Tax=Leptolyngbya sp. FACHB-261 TaxID=2692806 RepID=UPI001685FB85|nr:FAD-dependent oxidoreductase [Leptolyngbya sp. FACHB-261]MBD2102424.1 FAD-dependent monooxygenase [Leptolyngbya sp. FACHB-261]